MMLNTKLLSLLGILGIGIFSFDVSVASDDLEDTLKQALFLVELLKTDFTQVLREKNDVVANSTEEENSTCSLPPDYFNSTAAMNETEASGVSSTDLVWMTPSTPYTPPPLMPNTPPPSMLPGAPMILPNAQPGAPMMMPNAQPGAPMMMPNNPAGAPMMMPSSPPGAPMMMLNTPPGAPMMMPNTPAEAPMVMPYATWPAMAMGYPPPSGPSRRNFQDENYRFPYTFNRRRMMPDYYYFDSPIKSRGNFRRFGNDQTDDLGNTPATSQAQTTTSVSSAASEATTLNVGQTTASVTSLATTSEQSTSIPPTNSANHSIAATTYSANQTILQTNSSSQTILQTNSSNQTILQTNSSNQSILPTNSTNQPEPNNSTNQSVPTNSTNQFTRPTNSTDQSILATSDSIKQADNSDQILTGPGISILSTHKSTKQYIHRSTKKPKLRKIKPKTLRTKPRKRVRQEKYEPASKDVTTPLITKGNEKHYKGRNHHLRQHAAEDDVQISLNASESENIKEDVEMDQILSELENELDNNDKTSDNPNEEEIHEETSKSTKKTSKTTTMKVFLQASSRIPVPFPENNAFCHFYPKNGLCGTNL